MTKLRLSDHPTHVQHYVDLLEQLLHWFNVFKDSDIELRRNFGPFWMGQEIQSGRDLKVRKVGTTLGLVCSVITACSNDC